MDNLNRILFLGDITPKDLNIKQLPCLTINLNGLHTLHNEDYSKSVSNDSRYKSNEREMEREKVEGDKVYRIKNLKVIIDHVYFKQIDYLYPSDMYKCVVITMEANIESLSIYKFMLNRVKSIYQHLKSKNVITIVKNSSSILLDFKDFKDTYSIEDFLYVLDNESNAIKDILHSNLTNPSKVNNLGNSLEGQKQLKYGEITFVEIPEISKSSLSPVSSVSSVLKVNTKGRVSFRESCNTTHHYDDADSTKLKTNTNRKDVNEERREERMEERREEKREGRREEREIIMDVIPTIEPHLPANRRGRSELVDVNQRAVYYDYNKGENAQRRSLCFGDIHFTKDCVSIFCVVIAVVVIILALTPKSKGS